MADSYDDPESDTYSGNVLESSQSNKVLAIDTWKVTIPKLVYTIPYNVDGLCPYKVESDNWGKLMEKCKDDRPWKNKNCSIKWHDHVNVRYKDCKRDFICLNIECTYQS